MNLRPPGYEPREAVRWRSGRFGNRCSELRFRVRRSIRRPARFGHIRGRCVAQPLPKNHLCYVFQAMTPPTCDKCGATMVRFVVGLPRDFDAMHRAVAAGEVVWKGTCLADPSDPEWACAQCRRAELEKALAERPDRERLDDLDELFGPEGRERLEEWLAAIAAQWPSGSSRSKLF